MENRKYIRRRITWEGRRYEVRGTTEQEAIDKLAFLMEALKEGRPIINGSTEVNQWFRQWMRGYKEQTDLTAKSLRMYEEKYRKYIAPAIGTMRLRDVRDIHLQEIMNRQAGRSFSHATKLRLVMQELFRQAYRSRLISFDPAEGLRLPKCVRHSCRSLTEEERAHLLEVAREHPSGLWVLLILYTGLRPGEAAALQWKDVDFERNEIHVTKAVESGSNRIKPPKTPAGVRDIPMRQELRRLLAEVQGEPFQLLFPTREGTVRSPSSVRRLWTSFAHALDLHMGAVEADGKIIEHAIAPDLTLYCLRHTFCTDLQRAGVAINVAKELMGHSSIAVTADIYTHRDRTLLHETVSCLDKFDSRTRADDTPGAPDFPPF